MLCKCFVFWASIELKCVKEALVDTLVWTLTRLHCTVTHLTRWKKERHLKNYTRTRVSPRAARSLYYSSQMGFIVKACHCEYWVLLYMLYADTWPSRHKTLNQCWFNVGWMCDKYNGLFNNKGSYISGTFFMCQMRSFNDMESFWPHNLITNKWNLII